mmetsp:Transcript_8121/g.25047  ORF Transcript_8121/g.25047 Transcript_8121/m.25047 type:complete len:281 (+) Transcript_8121:1355-2197(+)
MRLGDPVLEVDERVRADSRVDVVVAFERSRNAGDDNRELDGEGLASDAKKVIVWGRCLGGMNTRNAYRVNAVNRGCRKMLRIAIIGDIVLVEINLERRRIRLGVDGEHLEDEIIIVESTACHGQAKVSPLERFAAGEHSLPRMELSHNCVDHIVIVGVSCIIHAKPEATRCIDLFHLDFVDCSLRTAIQSDIVDLISRGTDVNICGLRPCIYVHIRWSENRWGVEAADNNVEVSRILGEVKAEIGASRMPLDLVHDPRLGRDFTVRNVADAKIGDHRNCH